MSRGKEYSIVDWAGDAAGLVSEVVVRLDFDHQIVLGGQFFVWVSCATILDLFMQTLIVLLALGSRHISGVDLRLGTC